MVFAPLLPMMTLCEPILSEEERHLFARLAVFAGGCTLEAAKEVADADLDTLQSLVEKSLLRFTDGRYWMLETIREFAEERLEESGGADALHRRHAGYFLALAEEAEPNLRGSPKDWLDRLEAEHDNLRAAFDRFGALGESQLALRLAGALWRFWHQRGHPAEGRRRLESALGSDLLPTAARAKALNGASRLAIEGGGDAATARLRAEEGLALASSEMRGAPPSPWPSSAAQSATRAMWKERSSSSKRASYDSASSATGSTHWL
jgi:hypothetical protein